MHLRCGGIFNDPVLEVPGYGRLNLSYYYYYYYYYYYHHHHHHQHHHHQQQQQHHFITCSLLSPVVKEF